MTNLLYSGEQFNPVSGLQYLRARWYNPIDGRFNRLDPFAGNQQSPLSFHKYAYAHMNPINNIDPTGEFSLYEAMMVGLIIGSLTGAAAGFAVSILRENPVLSRATAAHVVVGALAGGPLVR